MGSNYLSEFWCILLSVLEYKAFNPKWSDNLALHLALHLDSSFILKEYNLQQIHFKFYIKILHFKYIKLSTIYTHARGVQNSYVRSK